MKFGTGVIKNHMEGTVSQIYFVLFYPKKRVTYRQPCKSSKDTNNKSEKWFNFEHCG